MIDELGEAIRIAAKNLKDGESMYFSCTLRKCGENIILDYPQLEICSLSKKKKTRNGIIKATK